MGSCMYIEPLRGFGTGAKPQQCDAALQAATSAYLAPSEPHRFNFTIRQSSCATGTSENEDIFRLSQFHSPSCHCVPNEPHSKKKKKKRKNSRASSAQQQPERGSDSKRLRGGLPSSMRHACSPSSAAGSLLASSGRRSERLCISRTGGKCLPWAFQSC